MSRGKELRQKWTSWTVMDFMDVHFESMASISSMNATAWSVAVP